jgi:hypothetical protein
MVYANVQGAEFETITEVATSLTKIFKNLRNHGKMTLAAGIPQDSPEAQIVTWLNERYADFIKNLLGLLDSGKGNLQVPLTVEGNLTAVNFNDSMPSGCQG